MVNADKLLKSIDDLLKKSGTLVPKIGLSTRIGKPGNAKYPPLSVGPRVMRALGEEARGMSFLPGGPSMLKRGIFKPSKDRMMTEYLNRLNKQKMFIQNRKPDTWIRSAVNVGNSVFSDHSNDNVLEY